MAETRRKDIREQDAEKAQEQRKRPEPTPEHVKALADESVPFPGLLGVSAIEHPIERHAALLGDPRFSHSVNNSQKARMVTELQATYGNQYVQRLLESVKVQAKLTIGSPDDQYEREADRVADAVTRASTQSIQCQTEEEEEEEPIQTKLTSDIQIQRQAEEPEEEEEEEEERIQTKLINDVQVQRQTEEPEEEEEEPIQTKKAREQTPLIGSSLQSRINSLKGDGQPLPESTRKHFEPRFYSSFAQVRVHNNSQAANIARSINAKAFTTGKDIVFGAGQYSPATSTGKNLLAHELTHVVQQCRKSSLSPDGILQMNSEIELPSLQLRAKGRKDGWRQRSVIVAIKNFLGAPLRNYFLAVTFRAPGATKTQKLGLVKAGSVMWTKVRLKPNGTASFLAAGAGKPALALDGVALYKCPKRGPLLFEIMQKAREVEVTAITSTEAAKKVGAKGTVGVDFKVVSVGGEVSAEEQRKRGRSIAKKWKVILPSSTLIVNQK